MKYIKIATSLALLLFFTNCITVKKAPEVNSTGYTIVQGKKLKRSLGTTNYFVFHNHLYDNDLTAYMEYRLNAEENSFLQNIPVKINDIDFLLTLRTVSSKDVTLDFLAPMANKALNKNLKTDYDENIQTIETEHFYVAIYVESNSEADCLKEESIYRTTVEKYLISLMQQYQSIGSQKELNFIIGK